MNTLISKLKPQIKNIYEKQKEDNKHLCCVMETKLEDSDLYLYYVSYEDVVELKTKLSRHFNPLFANEFANSLFLHYDVEKDSKYVLYVDISSLKMFQWIKLNEEFNAL